jgi:hypothetical protein
MFIAESMLILHAMIFSFNFALDAEPTVPFFVIGSRFFNFD